MGGVGQIRRDRRGRTTGRRERPPHAAPARAPRAAPCTRRRCTSSPPMPGRPRHRRRGHRDRPPEGRRSRPHATPRGTRWWFPAAPAAAPRSSRRPDRALRPRASRRSIAPSPARSRSDRRRAGRSRSARRPARSRPRRRSPRPEGPPTGGRRPSRPRRRHPAAAPGRSRPPAVCVRRLREAAVATTRAAAAREQRAEGAAHRTGADNADRRHVAQDTVPVMTVLVPSTLRSELERGLTLPASWYSSAEILALEHERIFGRSWQYAGVLEQVSEPGAFFTCRAGETPIVVVRNREGELRAFVNVCRHRGHEVAVGCGRRETLQCPYHAWTYDLDGFLRAAPRSERESGFDHADWSLQRVLVDTWGPLVFVNPDPDAAPLAGTLGELPRADGRARSRSVDAHVSRQVARVDHRGELEDRRRELPRVLPLPRRAQELQPAHRRRPGRVPVDDGPLVLEPVRTRPGGRRPSPLRPRQRDALAASSTSSGRTGR